MLVDFLRNEEAQEAIEDITAWANLARQQILEAASPARPSKVFDEDTHTFLKMTQPLRAASDDGLAWNRPKPVAKMLYKILMEQAAEVKAVLDKLESRGVVCPRIDSVYSPVSAFYPEFWSREFVSAWLVVWLLRNVQYHMVLMAGWPTTRPLLKYPAPPDERPKDRRRLRNCFDKLMRIVDGYVGKAEAPRYRGELTSLRDRVLSCHSTWLHPKPSGIIQLSKAQAGRRVTVDTTGLVGFASEALHLVGHLSVEKALEELEHLFERTGIRCDPRSDRDPRQGDAFDAKTIGRRRSRFLRAVDAGERVPFASDVLLVY